MVHDVASLTADLNDLTGPQMALLLGLLCGEYSKHPESKFWDVLIDFSRQVKRR